MLWMEASPVAQMVKNLPAIQETGFNPWVGKIPWRRKWQPTPVFLPRESHGQRSLTGYSLWGHKESDTTEQLSRFYEWGWASKKSRGQFVSGVGLALPQAEPPPPPPSSPRLMRVGWARILPRTSSPPPLLGWVSFSWVTDWKRHVLFRHPGLSCSLVPEGWALASDAKQD